MLVSAVQQNESIERLHIATLFWISFPFSSLQSIEYSSLCYTQQALINCLFYTQHSIYVNPYLPIHPTTPLVSYFFDSRSLRPQNETMKRKWSGFQMRQTIQSHHLEAYLCARELQTSVKQNMILFSCQKRGMPVIIPILLMRTWELKKVPQLGRGRVKTQIQISLSAS